MTITRKGCARGMAQVTIALIALIFIIIGVAYGGDKVLDIIIGGQLERQAAISEHERQERIREAETKTEVEKIETLRWMEITVSGAWLVFKGGLALVALAASSALVVAVWRLALGQVRSVREGWATAHARASRQEVPQTITYAPSPRVHYSVKSDSASGALPNQQPPLLPLLPDFTDLMTIPLPAPEIALLGLGPNGKPITNKWTKAKHIAIIGPTGGGKSVLSKTLIVQSLRSGHDVHILDPHFTRFDAETGEDWSPVTDRLQSRPVTKVPDIVHRLQWAVSEMKRRLELREEGEKYLPYIIRLVLDEVPAIVDEDESAADLIARVLREGRKVGVLLQMASQDMLAKTLGFKNGAAVRKNFSTAFIMRDCDSTSSRLFVKDKEFKPETLDVGIASIVTEGQRGHVIARIPYTSNEAVEKILMTLTPSSPTKLQKTLPQPAGGQMTGGNDGFSQGQSRPNEATMTPPGGNGGTSRRKNDDDGHSGVTVIGQNDVYKTAKDKVFGLLRMNPQADYGLVAELVGTSRDTVRKYAAEWRKGQATAYWGADTEGSQREPNYEIVMTQLGITDNSIVERYYEEWRKQHESAQTQ